MTLIPTIIHVRTMHENMLATFTSKEEVGLPLLYPKLELYLNHWLTIVDTARLHCEEGSISQVLDVYSGHSDEIPYTIQGRGIWSVVYKPLDEYFVENGHMEFFKLTHAELVGCSSMASQTQKQLQESIDKRTEAHYNEA